MQHLLRKGLGSPHVTSGPGSGTAPRPRARARARGPVRPGLGHRPRRRDPRAGHRAGGRGADPRPARAQGGAAQRRPARGGLEPPVHARRAPPTPPCASRPVPRRRRWPRWRPRSAPPRAGGTSLDELATRAGATAGFIPGDRSERRRPAEPRRRRARRRRGAARRRRRRGHLGRARARRRARRRRPGRRCSRWPTRSASPSKPESGLIGIPAETNGRGLREVGCSAGARRRAWPTPTPRAIPTPRAARCCCSRPTRREPELARARAR